MRKVTRISVALGTSAAMLSLAAIPASAAEGDADSKASITVESGPLSISVPGEATSVVSEFGDKLGRTATITLPNVAVTDHRSTDKDWNVSVTLTDFAPEDGLKSEGGEPLTAIKANGAQYRIDSFSHLGASVALSQDSVKLIQADGARAAGTLTAQVEGNNVTSWNALVDVAVPANVLMSNYAATLTHSVY